ncbi:MAG: PASTA domain-containing protein [Oscillospiraceae bacterium]|nr:PASTA domain-containing protein [Oscillospiraceae bacterium]
MNELKLCANCMSAHNVQEAVCPVCGYNGENTNPNGALPVGTIIGERYTIGRFLDLDGEGSSYYGLDNTRMEKCVIKEFMPVSLCSGRAAGNQILPKEGSEVLYKTTMMDFAEVYKNLLRIGPDEGIVETLNVVHDNNTVYAITEYVEGVDLESYLESKGGMLSYTRAMHLLQPVFAAVKKIHDANMLHRGIAPENIAVMPDGQVKLGGFATQALRTYKGEIKSQLYPGYSAPEQYAITEFQGKYTDIYALAAVIMRCVTGITPQSARERAKEDLLLGDIMEAPLPAAAFSSVTRALQLRPAARFTDVQMLVEGEQEEIWEDEEPQESNGINTKLLIVTVALVCITAITMAVMWITISRNLALKNQQSAEPSSSTAENLTQTETVMPNFVGQRYADVQANAAYQQKYIFIVEEQYSADYRQGEIISQSPAGGEAASADGTVRLVISKGIQTVELPDLSGWTKEDATARLKELGVNYQFVAVQNDGTVEAGRVTGTDKAVGATLEVGKDTVVLYIANEA